LRRVKPHCHCFLYVTPCGLVCEWRPFGGTYWLRLQCKRFSCSEDGGSSFFIASAVAPAWIRGVRHRTEVVSIVTPARTSDLLPQSAVRGLFCAWPILSQRKEYLSRYCSINCNATLHPIKGVSVSGIFLTGLTAWDASHILGALCKVRKNSLYWNHVLPTSNVD